MMLTLYLNATSPYARVVRVCSIEKQLNLTLVMVDPWSNPHELLTLNPAAKVPVLITESGVALSETLVILNYLDAIYPREPAIGADAQVMQWLSMGQALMDSSFQSVIEHKYTQQPHGELMQRRQDAIQRILAYLETQSSLLQAHPVSVAHLSIGVALEYLDFRLTTLNWRQSYPQLARWLDDIAQRESFQQTRFV